MKVVSKAKLYSQQLMADIKKGTPGMLEIAGDDIVTKAKEIAPWAEGDLKKSINMRTAGKDIEVGTAIKYGIYQEYGTRFQDGTPFMRPAINVITKGVSTTRSMAGFLTQNIKDRKARILSLMV